MKELIWEIRWHHGHLTWKVRNPFLRGVLLSIAYVFLGPIIFDGVYILCTTSSFLPFFFLCILHNIFFLLIIWIKMRNFFLWFSWWTILFWNAFVELSECALVYAWHEFLQASRHEWLQSSYICWTSFLSCYSCICTCVWSKLKFVNWY